MVAKAQGNYAPDGSKYVTIADGNGNAQSPAYPTAPTGVTPLHSSSGNVAAASAVATLAAAAGVTTYLSGLAFTSAGATVGSVITGTITGLIGGTMSFTVTVVTGATANNEPLFLAFNPPLPASAANTAIVITVPSLGAGNTNSTVSAWGYRV